MESYFRSEEQVAAAAVRCVCLHTEQGLSSCSVLGCMAVASLCERNDSDAGIYDRLCFLKATDRQSCTHINILMCFVLNMLITRGLLFTPIVTVLAE
jgi:hypothetical protein